MKCLLGSVGAVAFLLGTVSLVALEPLALYDAFNDAFIDPGRWVVPQQGSPAHREYVREIRGGRLRMADRAYGGTANNVGGSFDAVFLDFSDPDAVTALGADVRVGSLEVSSCAANPIGSTTAELYGDFFNVDTPVSGSHTNDVRASINLYRFSNASDPPGVLHVIAFVRQCLTGDCSSNSLLAMEDLGSVSVGERARLSITWDKDSDEFIFNSNGATFVASYAGVVSDDEPPGRKTKGLMVANFVGNCTGALPPVAYMEASFDRVIVNSSAASQ